MKNVVRTAATAPTRGRVRLVMPAAEAERTPAVCDSPIVALTTTSFGATLTAPHVRVSAAGHPARAHEDTFLTIPAYGYI